MIAHRLSTIVDADEIFVLHNGQIAERGHHNQLMQKETSIYKDLWNKQHQVALDQLHAEQNGEELDTVYKRNKNLLTQVDYEAFRGCPLPCCPK